MDDDPGSIRIRRIIVIALTVTGCAALSIVAGGSLLHPLAAPQTVWAETQSNAEPAIGLATALAQNFSPAVIAGLILSLALSAYFSGSEVAFFSIHRVRLRGMAEERSIAGRLVANMMNSPGRLLTTILIGNMIVNVTISVAMPPRLERALGDAFALPPSLSYPLTLALSTVVLVFFGEIAPKVLAVRVSQIYARAAVLPLRAVDWVLSPLRWSLIRFTESLFRITGISDIQTAPFITDDEFMHVLSDSEAKGVIEEEEGQMIQSIIESGDADIREILVPRPDVVALDHDATIGAALEVFREHQFSRMPVYADDLDHITGILFAKDLLPSVVKGDTARTIGPMARPPNFVPETMTVREFVRESQRKHMHLSIVVDEYGGTEGVVTLDDAIREVVGAIGNKEREAQAPYKVLSKGCFLVDGSFPLDDLSELIGIDLKDAEHETVAGFFIDRTNKVPEPGDRLTYDGIQFTVESVEGKRAAQLRVDLPGQARPRPAS